MYIYINLIVIAFLMLAYNNLKRTYIWDQFLLNKDNKYTIYNHGLRHTVQLNTILVIY